MSSLSPIPTLNTIHDTVAAKPAVGGPTSPNGSAAPLGAPLESTEPTIDSPPSPLPISPDTDPVQPVPDGCRLCPKIAPRVNISVDVGGIAERCRRGSLRHTSDALVAAAVNLAVFPTDSYRDYIDICGWRPTSSEPSCLFMATFRRKMSSAVATLLVNW